MIAVLQRLETRQMDPETTEELALAKRVTDGDEGALNALYERHAESLFAFVCHHLDGARPEAEEIWQDTLVSAIRALPSYRGQSRFFSWLCSIARNKIADHWRRKSRKSQNFLLMPPEDLAQVMDDGPVPEELLRQRATCVRVVEVLSLLPSDYRTALVARYADGHSVEEVARILNKTYKATESLMSRAKEAFRRALAAQTEVEL